MFNLLMIDDFSQGINRVREEVLKTEFKSEIGPDGATYTGISEYQVPDWNKLLALYLGWDIDVKLSFFRMNFKGEMPHSWVHSDILCADYAALVYMNPPSQCKGGTAFWRHTALDIDHLPAKQDLASRGANPDWFYSMITREWRELSYWEQTAFVGMKYNRLITYPSNRFHSRYPFEGFGSTKDEARLVWTCFYDRHKTARAL